MMANLRFSSSPYRLLAAERLALYGGLRVGVCQCTNQTWDSTGLVGIPRASGFGGVSAGRQVLKTERGRECLRGKKSF